MGTLLKINPQRSDFSIAVKSGIVKTELEGGPARYRKDQIGIISLVNVTWHGKSQEMDYLRAFYRAATLNGSQPFDIYLKVDSSTPTLYEDVHFVPGSFRFMGKSGDAYAVGAQIAVKLD